MGVFQVNLRLFVCLYMGQHHQRIGFLVYNPCLKEYQGNVFGPYLAPHLSLNGFLFQMVAESPSKSMCIALMSIY